MRARRAHVVGVLLASAHLVAARPFGQSNASVVPFSQSSVEFSQARRALTGYVMDNSNIKTAVAAWLADRRKPRQSAKTNPISPAAVTPAPSTRPATVVRMGTVEAIHAADASAAPPAQATLVPHATVISVQGP